MKKCRAGMWLIVGAIVVLGLPVVSSHAAVNLLTNGSFESGLTGWVIGGTQLTYLPAVIGTTPPNPGGAFGEAVPADTVGGGSPDLAGTHVAYFVDDFANQSLTQSIILAAGTYEIGFDTYYPLNGYNNLFDASFNGTILGDALVTTTVHSGTAQLWNHYAGTATVAAGAYDVAFNFFTNGFPAADVVVDRVYITNVAVPEPVTLLLLGSGLMGLLAAGRKKFRK